MGGISVVVLLFCLVLVSSAGNINEKNVVATVKTDKTGATTPKKTDGSVGTPTTPTFTNIFPSRGSYQCSYEEVTPSTRTSNTIYFSDGKMRGEFRTVGGGGNIMVYDGVNMYVWKEGQTVGTVSQPKSISDFPAIVPRDINTGKVLGAGLNSASWYCYAWARVPSLLEKPSYVKF